MWFKETCMGARLTGYLDWEAWVNHASQNFLLCIFLEWPQKIWHEICKVDVKHQKPFFYTRKIGAGTFILYMLVVCWLTLLARNSSQACNCFTLPCIFFWVLFSWAMDVFTSLMKGAHISWRTPISSRLESVRAEMSPSLWMTTFAFGYQLVLGLYFIFIFPSQLPSLWTSSYHLIYKDCLTISHNCIGSDLITNSFMYINAITTITTTNTTTTIAMKRKKNRRQRRRRDSSNSSDIW